MKTLARKLGLIVVAGSLLYLPENASAVDFECSMMPVVDPTAPFTCRTIADTDTPVPPGDTENFLRFFFASTDGGNAAFRGDATSTFGIYKSIDKILFRVADIFTAVPDSNPVRFFDGFSQRVSIEGDTVAFKGSSGAGPRGIYTGNGGPIMMVVDTETPIPGGIGTFRNFPFFPAYDNGMTAFVGDDAGAFKVFGQIGVYKGNADKSFDVLANEETLIPSTDPAWDKILTFGCPGTFCEATFAFRDPSIENGKVVFVGAGGTGDIVGEIQLGGIYKWVDGVLEVVADSKLFLPSTTILFEGFSSLSLDGHDLAFFGVGGGIAGVYTVIDGVIVLVADTTTPIPEGIGGFTSVSDPSMDRGKVAFFGGAASQGGIYTNFCGALSKVINLTDTINGKSINILRFYVEGLSGNQIAFRAEFDDGTAGVFLVTLNTEMVTLNTVQDSFLKRRAKNDNEGENPLLPLGERDRTRVVAGFDATSIDALVTSGELISATLVLNIADNNDNWNAELGQTVDAHPLLADFTEGNGLLENILRTQATRGTGPGVTWNCATDMDIANRRIDCVGPWDGGLFDTATAAAVSHVNGLTGEVSWDVTDDVLAGAVGWLVKKTNEKTKGQVRYSSKEAAAAAGNPDLAPRLVLETCVGG